MTQTHKGVILCFKCNSNLKAVYCGGSKLIKLNKYMYCPHCKSIFIVEQKEVE